VQEVHRAFGVTLADAPANDRLLRPGHTDEHVLIAFGVDLVALDVLLLLAGAKSIPISRLKIGSFHMVEGKRLQVNSSAERYQRELAYLLSIL